MARLGRIRICRYHEPRGNGGDRPKARYRLVRRGCVDLHQLMAAETKAQPCFREHFIIIIILQHALPELFATPFFFFFAVVGLGYCDCVYIPPPDRPVCELHVWEVYGAA